MNTVVESRKEELEALCNKRHVTRLELFGSAAGVDVKIKPNNLDFLVEFASSTPEAHADRYFSLKEDLEALFGVSVDLVEAKAMKNPYFVRRVNESRTLIHAA